MRNGVYFPYTLSIPCLWGFYALTMGIYHTRQRKPLYIGAGGVFQFLQKLGFIRFLIQQFSTSFFLLTLSTPYLLNNKKAGLLCPAFFYPASLFKYSIFCSCAFIARSRFFCSSGVASLIAAHSLASRLSVSCSSISIACGSCSPIP